MRRRSFSARSGDGVSVHHGTVKTRYVQVRGDGIGQHTAGRSLQRHELAIQRLPQLRVEPGEGGIDRVAMREATHPHIGCCGSVVVSHGGLVTPSA